MNYLPRILPSKHTTFYESILGLGGILYSGLASEISFDGLLIWYDGYIKKNKIKITHTPENIILALDFLYIIGLIDIKENGNLTRCD